MASVYIATLGRDPDPSGWMYWSFVLDQNLITQDQLVNSFFGSDEYRTSPNACPAAIPPSSATNQAFVTCLYQAALHRNPDTGGPRLLDRPSKQ